MLIRQLNQFQGPALLVLCALVAPVPTLAHSNCTEDVACTLPNGGPGLRECLQVEIRYAQHAHLSLTCECQGETFETCTTSCGTTGSRMTYNAACAPVSGTCSAWAETCNGCNDDPANDTLIDEGVCPATGCPVDTDTKDGLLNVYNGALCTDWIPAKQGERIHVRSAYEKLTFDNDNVLSLRKKVNGVETLALNSISNSNPFKAIDLLVPYFDVTVANEPLYRACLEMVGNHPSRYGRLTIDRAGLRPVLGDSCDVTPDVCAGAIGPQCGEPGSCSQTLTAQGIACKFSVGSNEHDTCCSHHPNGTNCGGTDMSDPICSPEWYKAVNDVLNDSLGVTTTRVIDPTVMTYRPFNLVGSSGQNVWRGGAPQDAVKFAYPHALDETDAEAGWCITGNWNSYLEPLVRCSAP